MPLFFSQGAPGEGGVLAHPAVHFLHPGAPAAGRPALVPRESALPVHRPRRRGGIEKRSAAAFTGRFLYWIPFFKKKKKKPESLCGLKRLGLGLWRGRPCDAAPFFFDPLMIVIMHSRLKRGGKKEKKKEKKPRSVIRCGGPATNRSASCDFPSSSEATARPGLESGMGGHHQGERQPGGLLRQEAMGAAGRPQPALAAPHHRAAQLGAAAERHQRRT